jgi:WD40 repeat protein
VAFSPDRRWLASAGYDHTARLWDAHTGEKVLALQGHADAVWGVAFSPEGQRLASASYDQTVKVRGVGLCECARRITPAGTESSL